MLEIPGDYLEGGGQILRTSIALSAVTGKPTRITNIRAKRKNPGLRVQHLEGIKAVAKLCNAELVGARIGSTQIEFKPSKIEGKTVSIFLSTAGSIGLIFQSIAIPASFAKNPVHIDIKGGSIASLWSPPVPYLQNVLLPVLEKIGYKADMVIKKYGFYPKGGSHVVFTIYPWKDKKPLELLEQGVLKSIRGLSLASEKLRKAKVAERQANKAEELLKESFGIEPDIKKFYVDSESPGSVLIIWLETNKTIIGSDVIGEPGLKSEIIAEKAVKKLVKDYESGACVDSHLSDQVLPFMALTSGKSIITVPELTGHVKTNMWVIEKFLPVKFETKRSGKYFVIECTGHL